MERDDNAEKGRQVRDAYSKNKPEEREKQQRDAPKQPLSKDHEATGDRAFGEKDRSDAEHKSEENQQKERENRKGMDEDLNVQQGGNYGHKSQNQAEKDGRGER